MRRFFRTHPIPIRNGMLYTLQRRIKLVFNEAVSSPLLFSPLDRTHSFTEKSEEEDKLRYLKVQFDTLEMRITISGAGYGQRRKKISKSKCDNSLFIRQYHTGENEVI